MTRNVWQTRPLLCAASLNTLKDSSASTAQFKMLRSSSSQNTGKKTWLDGTPELQEATKAIETLKSGKTAGDDGIPPAVWVNGEPSLHKKLCEFFVRCWEHSKLHIDVIFVTYKCFPGPPVYHPENSFNINLDVLENAGITSKRVKPHEDTVVLGRTLL